VAQQRIAEVYQRQQNLSDIKEEYILLNIMFKHNSQDAAFNLEGFEQLILRSEVV